MPSRPGGPRAARWTSLSQSEESPPRPRRLVWWPPRGLLGYPERGDARNGSASLGFPTQRGRRGEICEPSPGSRVCPVREREGTRVTRRAGVTTRQAARVVPARRNACTTDVRPLSCSKAESCLLRCRTCPSLTSGCSSVGTTSSLR